MSQPFDLLFSGDPLPAAPESSTARDTSANAPAETLTREKEASQMPLAGQANNHSSPAFEKRGDDTLYERLFNVSIGVTWQPGR